MSNLDIIKKELQTQKEAIETAGGKVVTTGGSPSIYDITAGIKSIEYLDTTLATATEEDVALGKTFYAGDNEIKTGTALSSNEIVRALFLSSTGEQTYEDEIYYAIPNYLTEVREYLFYNNKNSITIRFHDDITKINKYAFMNNINFIFENFHELPKLDTIGDYAFAYCNPEIFDFTALPDTIKTMNAHCFYNTVADNTAIKVPSSLDYMGSSIFRCDKRKHLRYLDVSNYKGKSLEVYACFYLAFDCDLIIPDTVKQVGSYFNYYGSFHNIVVPGNAALNAQCFCAPESDPISNYYLKTVTFLSETPATIGTKPFALQNRDNGFKIYVPDNALEEYKAKSGLSLYLNHIFPMSQKE